MQSSLPRQQIVLAYVAFILIGAHDGALGALLPSMRADYRLTAATVELLFISQTVGYLLISFNMGKLVARLGYRRFLVGGTLLFVVGTGAVALHPPIWLGVLAAGTFIGSGFATIDAGLNAYLASMPQTGSALNYMHACYGGGALLGPLIATSLLTLHAPWNVTYALWALSGVAIVLALWNILRVPVSPPTTDAADAARERMIAPWRLRFVVSGAVFLLVYVGIEASLGNWSFSVLHGARGVPILLAGWVISGYWAGLTLGRVVLARRVARIGEARMITECLIGTLIGLALAVGIPNGVGTSIALPIIGFFLGPIFPTMIALASRRVPADMLAGSIGFIISLGITGSALMPWLAGNVIQRAGLVALFPFALALMIPLGVLWYVAGSAPRECVSARLCSTSPTIDQRYEEVVKHGREVLELLIETAQTDTIPLPSAKSHSAA